MAVKKGNANPNTLNGTSVADTLSGLGGNDTLDGRAGNDELLGGSGNDLIIGGTGKDKIDGGTGADTVSYAAAPNAVRVNLAVVLQSGGTFATGDRLFSVESVTGSRFGDTLQGGKGKDALYGGNGNDILLGLGANDNLKGQNGKDRLDGGDGDDQVSGGAGDDLIIGSKGKDNIDGGSGVDTVSYATATNAVHVSLELVVQSGGTFATGDLLFNVENVIGSKYNDVLEGWSGKDILTGGNGNDTLVGTPGHDTLNGGNGNDTASYVNSTSPVYVNLNLATQSSSIGGDAAGDKLIGIENVSGSNRTNDTLIGNSHANILSGGDRNDTLQGGGGADKLIGGSGIDTVSYIDSGVGVTITLAVSTQHGGIAEGDKLSGIENLTGSNGKDALSGNSGANVVAGGNNNDVLSGAGGDDTLDGGAGDDILRGGAGRDHLSGGAGFDIADYSQNAGPVTLVLNSSGSNGDAFGDTFVVTGPPLAPVRDIEAFVGTAAGDTMVGSFAQEILSGMGGDDYLESGSGFDTLIGGTGSDRLVGSFTLVGSNETFIGGSRAEAGGGITNDGATDYFVVMRSTNATIDISANGTDVILNFEDGIDKIGVIDEAISNHSQAQAFTEIQSEATLSNETDAGGSFLLIKFNGPDDDVIKVYGLSVATFAAGDLAIF